MRKAPTDLSLTVIAPPTKKKKRKKRKKKKAVCGYIRVDLSCCRYQILRIVLRKLGWEATTDDSKPWHLIWTDTSIGPDRLMMLKRGQKINHFVGMLEICRKKALARNLSMMRKIFPAAYKFFPRAYILPNQLTQFLARFNTPKPRTYILKPDTGSMGRGVVLVQSSEEVKQAMKGLHGANFVAQKYLTKPMLLNGYKFDLRIYVLILSCNPLRLYLYKEGLARFCTEKYMKPDHKNLKVSRMHLTNYSLNKYSSKFEFNSSTSEVNKGSKWTLTALFKALAAQGFDTNQLDMQIKRMVVLTVIAIVPVLAHSYKTCLNEDDNGRSCFELLGLDVLVDEKCKPWLLEVNHSPSFSIDTPLDYMVKEALILDTLRLVNVDPTGMLKSKMEERRDSQIRLYGKLVEEPSCQSPFPEISTQTYEEYEVQNRGNFDRIYPTEDANLQKYYDRCLAGASELFTHSFDMKVKKEIAKVQEERRQEEMEKQEAEKRRIQMEVRKRARDAARNVAILRKEMPSQAAKQVVKSPPIKRSSSRLGKSSPSPISKVVKSSQSPALSLKTSSVSVALSPGPSPPVASPATSVPTSGTLEVEENIVEQQEQQLQELVDDDIPERIVERRPDSGSLSTSTPPSCSNVEEPASLVSMTEAEPTTPRLAVTSHQHHLVHRRNNSSDQHADLFTIKKLRGNPSRSDPETCFTTRGYVKSVTGLPPESKCAHCQRHQGRALALKNANALPMTLHEMTTLASSFLTHRWESDRSNKSQVAVPVKKNMGITESMKAQFRSKLLNFQRTGGFLANPGLLKPLQMQRLPWDASANSHRHRHRLNMILDATSFSN